MRKLGSLAMAVGVLLVPAGALSFEILQVEQTPFLRSNGDDYVNLVRARLRNPDEPVTATVTIVAADRESSSTLLAGPEESRVELLLPNPNEPTTATISISGAGKSVNQDVLLKPVRKWKIFAVPSIHVDIGYTDTREEVIKRHNDNLDQVIALCHQDPKFRWNVEVAWELENYRDERSTPQFDELLDLVRQGRIGLHAGYLNMLTALMSDEAMNRYCHFSADLAKGEELKTKTLILSDVPTATGALPSVLAASGIRYFAEGCNMDRGPMLRNSGFSNPFWWEGPDGARVLAYFSMHYARTAWMAECPTLQCFEEHVPRMIEPLREDYPSDAVYLYGGFLDNRPFNPGFRKHMDAYGERWDYPEIRIATSDEFFEYLEKDCGDRLEVKRADFGAFWEDGAGSTAQETAMHMENQRRLAVIETLQNLELLAEGYTGYQDPRVEGTWKDILFYAEHTWGAADSVSKPDDSLTLQQWSDKAHFAHLARKWVTSLLKESVQGYASSATEFPNGQAVIVNPLSFSRSTMVDLQTVLSLPQQQTATISLPTGELLETQWDQNRLLAHVPSMGGFAITPFSVTTSTATVKPQVESAGKLENDYYRITIEERGITSIVDKESGRDLIDASSPYCFGQVVYALGGGGTKMVHDHATTPAQFTLYPPFESSNPPSPGDAEVAVYPARVTNVEGGTTGPLFSEVVIQSTAPNMPHIDTSLRLFHKEKRLGIDVRISSKTEERRKEAVYVAFPLNAQQPQYRFGMTNTVADPARDFSPYGCHEWYCVQDFVSCRDAEGGEFLWSSPDAPLITISELNKGTWKQQPELTTPTIFSYAMNNYWHTNYKAGQGGDFLFRYNITSGAEPFSNQQCVEFARAAAMPLLATKVARAYPDKRPGSVPRYNFQAIGDGTIVSTVRSSMDGRGWIVRLRNLEPQDTTATVMLDGKAVQYKQVNMVENDLEPPAPVTDAPVRLKPFQTISLRLEKPST